MDEMTVYMWAVRHQIIPTLCFYCDTDKGTPTSFSPTGSCVPRTVKVRGKETVGLYCKRCCKNSKGGRRCFFLGQKTDFVRSMCMLYCIVNGHPYVHCKEFHNCGKNVWTKYVRDVGLVVGEINEARFQHPVCWDWGQFDEVAFGTRKYHRGKRVRKSGVQWALTGVKMDPYYHKPQEVICKFLPYNRRGCDEIVPIVTKRMEVGSTLETDCWRAYPKAAKDSHCREHLTVNHSKTFKEYETGANTNAVEGIHGMMKRDCRHQFYRLPSIKEDGECMYIDLIAWRTNLKINAKRKGTSANLFAAFLLGLLDWYEHPLPDFDPKVPVITLDNTYTPDEDEDAEWEAKYILSSDEEGSGDELIPDDPDYVDAGSSSD